MTVNKAAEELGTSTDAIRKRVQRDALESKKEDGRLLVWLDNGESDVSTPTQAHVDSLQEQVEFLRRELERKDAILLNMTEAMRSLNPPTSSEAPKSPRMDAEAPEGVEVPDRGPGPQEPTSRRPWWRRMFGS